MIFYVSISTKGNNNPGSGHIVQAITAQFGQIYQLLVGLQEFVDALVLVWPMARAQALEEVTRNTKRLFSFFILRIDFIKRMWQGVAAFS